jgi:glucose-1-phosphate cytidylyltransferase
LKCVILAGGFGTRFVEETKIRPKPLIEIGDHPIIWHIMKRYANFGIDDFVVCCGYKADMIKNYFKTFDESWNVSCIDTGLKTMTGGRLKKIQKLIKDETFCCTYGDTLNDVDIRNLIDFHKDSHTFATVTACKPPEKYGVLTIQKNFVTEFKEKPLLEGMWVNGGYFVLEPTIFDYIVDDSTVWEKEPLENLAKDKKLSAYEHTGFYKPMDTFSDKTYLENLWNQGAAPWQIC